MTSSDGFCSCVSFLPGELGQQHSGPTHHNRHHQHQQHQQTTSNTPPTTLTPVPTPNQSQTGSFSGGGGGGGGGGGASTPKTRHQSSSNTPTMGPMGSSVAATTAARAASPLVGGAFASAFPQSPARSMSASSAGTQSSFAAVAEQGGLLMTNATPTIGAVPAVSATGSSSPAVPGATGSGMGTLPLWTPPQTPMSGNNTSTASLSTASTSSGASAGAGARAYSTNNSTKNTGRPISNANSAHPTIESTGAVAPAAAATGVQPVALATPARASPLPLPSTTTSSQLKRGREALELPGHERGPDSVAAEASVSILSKRQQEDHGTEHARASHQQQASGERDAETAVKKRRIAPTPVPDP